MKKTMKVAVMNGIGQMGFVKRSIPQPAGNEVLVKLEYVGICGSDMHYYETGRIGDYIVEPPFVLGHEPGGTVVEVGKNVKHLKPGDRVALEPGKTCGHCEFCREGKYNLCPDVVFFATPPVDGVFQEYVAHEADLCFKLPENVDTLEVALIAPPCRRFPCRQPRRRACRTDCHRIWCWMHRPGINDGIESRRCIPCVCGGYHAEASGQGFGTGCDRYHQLQRNRCVERSGKTDRRKGCRSGH